MEMKKLFQTGMTKEKIIKRLVRLRNEFGVTHHLLARVGNGAMLRMSIQLPNGKIVAIQKINSKNARFEDNAAALLHMYESRIYDFRRGAISQIELLQQIASDVDLSVSQLEPAERALVLCSREALANCSGKKVNEILPQRLIGE